METFLRRNFKVKGNIASIYIPDKIALLKLIEGIEVKLWHKAPMEKIFLGNGVTDNEGNFIIEFEVDSPVNYIVDGKISDVFLEAYYNGEKISDHPASTLLLGLAAYWKFDETDGATAADATGNMNTGEFAGTDLPTWSTGRINHGLFVHGNLDGSRNSYLNVLSSESFYFGTGDFTLACWVKPNNTSDKFGIIDSGNDPTGFSLNMYTPNKFIFMVSGSDVLSGNTTIVPGTWYHFVVRRIGSEVELFVNNISLSNETFTDPVGYTESFILIGKNNYNKTLDGIIDEFGIWKGHGLTNDEIAELYNKGYGLQYPFIQ